MIVLESVLVQDRIYQYLSPIVYRDVFDSMIRAQLRGSDVGFIESISHRVGSDVAIASDLVSMIFRNCDLEIPEIVGHIHTAARVLPEGGLLYVFCHTHPYYLIRYHDRIHAFFEVYLHPCLGILHA